VRKNFFRKLTLLIAPILIFLLMKLLWFTYRKKYHFIDEPINEQCMAVTWHAELLIAPQVYKKLRKKQKTAAIIAQHHDGEIIARTFKFLNILPLRGSSRKGAKAALMAAIKALKEGYSVMITPDGPKGPRYSMSDGAVALALRSNLPLMIVNYLFGNSVVGINLSFLNHLPPSISIIKSSPFQICKKRMPKPIFRNRC